MENKGQPAMTSATQPEANIAELTPTASSTGAPTEDKTRSASVSPPPVVPVATKPSALAGQSTASPPIQSSPSPVPETRTANAGAQDVARDPQVASLKAIFPDYDDAVLQSVLESVGGDQDRAIDLLLGMSDPNFKSEAPPIAAAPSPQMTQEELDEQLARRLMLEEQQQAQQWQQQHQQRPHRRSSRPQQQTEQTTPPIGGKDTMTEFQEQFSKIAESGKKSFGAFMTKVKAKIQEFDKPNPDASGSGVQPTWGSANSSSYYDPNAATQPPPPRTNYQPYHGHSTTGGIHSPPTSTPSNTAISQPAAFYDPNPSPQPMSPPTQYSSPNLGEKKPTQSIVVEGYDVTPVASETSVAAPQPAQSTTAAASTGGSFAASVPPRGPSPANPIDGGKLGLLPKRPISLIRDPPQNQPQVQRHNSDDDDLEYSESPFDDDRK